MVVLASEGAALSNLNVLGHGRKIAPLLSLHHTQQRTEALRKRETLRKREKTEQEGGRVAAAPERKVAWRPPKQRQQKLGQDLNKL